MHLLGLGLTISMPLCSKTFTLTLSRTFFQYLTQSYFETYTPSPWKPAIIFPILKSSEDPFLSDSYRPATLASVLFFPFYESLTPKVPTTIIYHLGTHHLALLKYLASNCDYSSSDSRDRGRACKHRPTMEHLGYWLFYLMFFARFQN